MTTVLSEELHTAVGRMLHEIANDPDLVISPLEKGGNNRLYMIEVAGSKYILKQYFQHRHDSRDRLDAEYSFSAFAWQQGIRCIPKPIVSDKTTFCALYEFVEGDPIAPGNLSGDEVHQALAFYLNLNQLREHPGAQALANASESSFTLAQHVHLIERRIKRFDDILPTEPIDYECLAYVNGPLRSAWNRIRAHIEDSSGYHTDRPLPILDRVLSPSDFGYHNALRAKKGLVFLDFEYAGWDDPAKVVGDFFSQAAIPAPLGELKRFANAVASIHADPTSILHRINLLCPLYRIKWCCIVLNEFLPMDADRRAFAQGQANNRKQEQLGKAVKLLSSLESLREEALRN